MRSWLAAVVSLVLCLGVGLSASFMTATSVRTWYPTLEKPSWNPPSAAFGPVWTALYVMMAVAAWMIWREQRSPDRVNALVLFGVQLALNGIWSVIFFGMRSPGSAFAEIVVLWVAIVATIAAFAKLNKAAAWLLLPYLIWVTFAAALNFTVWRLNA